MKLNNQSCSDVDLITYLIQVLLAFLKNTKTEIRCIILNEVVINFITRLGKIIKTHFHYPTFFSNEFTMVEQKLTK